MSLHYADLCAYPGLRQITELTKALLLTAGRIKALRLITELSKTLRLIIELLRWHHVAYLRAWRLVLTCGLLPGC